MSAYAPPKRSWADNKLYLKGIFPAAPTFVEKDYPSFKDKVVFITGANSGVGYEVAKSLLGATEATIYFLCRNKQRSEDAVKRLESDVAKDYNKKVAGRVHYVVGDLGDLTSLKPAVEEFLKQLLRLDLIIHNAGVMDPPEGSKTAQGFEMQIGVNAFGPHYLQKLLDPVFIKTAATNKPGESRIVWVSSTCHMTSPLGGLDFEDPWLTKSAVGLRYDQSKALNAIQARWWPRAHAEAVAENNIISVSVCPGFLASDLSRSYSQPKRWFFKTFMHPVRNGAYTELFAAFSPEVTLERNGQHIISHGRFSHLRKDIDNDETNEKVWNFLDEQIKPYQ